MLFWFKKKETVLDCFTYSHSTYDYLKIDRAVKFIPDWFKNLESGSFSDPYNLPFITMKKCSGFLNYFSNSFAVPMWDYVYCRVDKDNVDIKTNISSIINHSPRQYNGFLDETYYHIKIETPWYVESNNKVKFIQTFPAWCYSPRHKLGRFIHMPGVVDFYYQRSTNINGFIKKNVEGEDPYVLNFEPGVPIAFYTPLEETKITFKYHLISKEEFNQKSGFVLPSPGYKRLALVKKLIDKRDNDKKCPFGFGK